MGDAPYRYSSVASPGDIFGVSEPAVGRDPGVLPSAVADVGERGEFEEVHREAVCLRPLIERPLRPLRAGRVHHVVPHLDAASKAVTESLVRLPGCIELVGYCRQVGEGGGYRGVDAAVAELQQARTCDSASGLRLAGRPGNGR